MISPALLVMTNCTVFGRVALATVEHCGAKYRTPFLRELTLRAGKFRWRMVGDGPPPKKNLRGTPVTRSAAILTQTFLSRFVSRFRFASGVERERARYLFLTDACLSINTVRFLSSST